MSIYKRGDVYWYEFQFKGQRIQESSHTSNKEARARLNPHIACAWQGAKQG
jgi:hypothetical protein